MASAMYIYIPEKDILPNVTLVSSVFLFTPFFCEMMQPLLISSFNRQRKGECSDKIVISLNSLFVHFWIDLWSYTFIQETNKMSIAKFKLFLLIFATSVGNLMKGNWMCAFLVTQSVCFFLFLSKVELVQLTVTLVRLPSSLRLPWHYC